MANPNIPVVLVVDDEPLIRMYAVDVLEDAGFSIVEAGSAEEALDQLSCHPEITVLFTDINMPGKLDGLDLAREVHRRRPHVQLIVASGKMRPSPDEIPDDGRFFAKPYDGTAIVRLIESQRGDHLPTTH